MISNDINEYLETKRKLIEHPSHNCCQNDCKTEFELKEFESIKQFGLFETNCSKIGIGISAEINYWPISQPPENLNIRTSMTTRKKQNLTPDFIKRSLSAQVELLKLCWILIWQYSRKMLRKD